MRQRQHQQDDDADINITPMLDIVFIMLIFFIVTTSFIKEPGIDPDRPEALTAQWQPRANIVLAISEDNQIWMDKKSIALTQVRESIKRARAEVPESSVMIVADQHANTGVLVDVMDQVAAGGISNIYVAAKTASAL